MFETTDIATPHISPRSKQSPVVITTHLGTVMKDQRAFRHLDQLSLLDTACSKYETLGAGQRHGVCQITRQIGSRYNVAVQIARGSVQGEWR